MRVTLRDVVPISLLFLTQYPARTAHASPVLIVIDDIVLGLLKGEHCERVQNGLAPERDDAVVACQYEPADRGLTEGQLG